MERAAPVSALNLTFGFRSLVQRAFGINRNEGVENRVIPFDQRQASPGQLDGRSPLLFYLFGSFGQSEARE